MTQTIQKLQFEAIHYPGIQQNSFGYTQHPRILLLRLPRGIALCCPPYGESIDSVAARLSQQDELPLISDFGLYVFSIRELFVSLGMPEEYTPVINAAALEFLNDLKAEQGLAKRASQFNVLMNGGRKTYQACAAFPWILDVLADPGEAQWSVKLRATIDNAQPLNAYLASALKTSEGAIRRLHNLPREILGKQDSNTPALQRHFRLSLIAQTLGMLPKNKLPEKTADWQTVWDAAYWSYEQFGEPFLPKVAVRAYIAWRDSKNFDDLLDDGSVSQVRLFVEQTTPHIEMRSMVNGRQKRLCYFVFEWLCEQHGPVHLKKIARRLARRLGNTLRDVDLDLELNHLNVQFSWGLGPRQRKITPFTRSGQMRHEGAQLRNCMAGLISQAIFQDWSPFFSIRDGKGRTKAHLEVGLKGVFHLIQAEGPGNADADEASLEAAVEFVAHLNASPPEQPSQKPDFVAHRRDILAIDQGIRHAIRRWALVPVEDNAHVWRK